MSRLNHPTELPSDLADLNPTAPSRRMTEEEFVAWYDEDVRAEWIDGEVVVMSPASSRHVQLTVFLVRVFADFVEARGLGQILSTELMVRPATLQRRWMPDVRGRSRAPARRESGSRWRRPRRSTA